MKSYLAKGHPVGRSESWPVKSEENKIMAHC